jgi:hypothetical protein
MKQCVFWAFSFLVSSVVFTKVNAQVPVAYYDFEDNANRNNTVETAVQEIITGVGSPSLSTSSLTAAHGSGNGTTYSGSNAGYAIGYYGFTSNATSASTDPSINVGPFDCTGFSTLTLTFDVLGVGAQAPANVDVYWSTNNVTFTRIVPGTNTVANGTWNNRSFTLPAGANGAATLYIRVIGYNGGAIPTAGNGEIRIDNLTLSAAIITSSKTLISTTAQGTGLSSGGSYFPLYTNLTVNAAAITVTAAGNITFTGTLTLTNGEFVVGANTLTFQTGNTPLARTSGSLTLGATSNLVFGTTGNTGGNAFTLPNSIFTTSPVVLNNLTINRTNALTLGNQGITIDGGTLTLTAGAFSLAANTLTLQNSNTPFARTTGTLTVATTSNIAFGSTGNTGGNEFTIPTGFFTASPPSLGNFTVNRANSLTLGNQGITVNGTLTLEAGVFDVAANTLTVQTAATPIVRTSGTLTVGTTSSLVFGTNAGSFTIPDNVFTAAPSINNLTINRAGGVIIGNQNFTINGTLTLTAGAFDVQDKTLTFQTGNTPITRGAGTITTNNGTALIFGTIDNIGGNAFTIPANTFTTNPTINSLTVNRTNQLVLNSQTWTIDGGQLTLTAGALNIAARTIIFQNAATPITRTSGTLVVSNTTNITFGANASSFTIPNGTFSAAPSINNLIIDRAGGVTIGNQAFTINGTLTLTNGAFDILSTTLTMQTGATPIARTSGTLTVGTGASLSFGANVANFTIPDNTFTTDPNITNLTINRAGGITVGNQNFTINGTLTLTAGVFNTLNTTLTFQNGNTPLARTTGTLTLGATANLVFGTAGNTGGTAFTIPNNIFTTAPSINHFTINRINSLTLGNQSLTLDGTLTLTAGAFAIGANTLTLQNNATPITVVAGTITTTTTTNINFGVNAANFTIPDNTFTAAPSLNNLTIDRAGGITLGNQSVTVIGTLTLTNGALSVASNTLTFQTGNTPIARTAGSITTTSSSNLVFGTAGNTGGTAFTIPDDVFTTAPSLNNLTINRTNSLALGNQDLTLAGTLTLTAGTLNNAGRNINITAGNIAGTGIEAGAGTIVMTGSGATISGATISNLQLNNTGGFSLSGSPTINGTLTLTAGALNVGANTLTFHTSDLPLARTAGSISTSTTSNLVFGTVGNTGGNAFILPDDVFTSIPTLNNFTINRTNTLTLGNQGFTIVGTLTLTAGVLDAQNNTLTFQTGNTPLARTSGTLTLGSNANLVFGTAGNLGGNAFTLPNNIFTSAPSINNITINRTNAITLGNQDLTINGTLTLTAGAFAIAANTLTLQNGVIPIVRTAGTITLLTTSNIVLGTQASSFTIPDNTFTAAPSLNNLTIDRAGGITIGNQAFTINGTLTLTNGAFDILNTTLTMQTGATPIAKTNGTLTVGTASTLSFGANAAAFTIPNNLFTTAPVLSGLIINRAGGVTIGNQDFTLNGTLTLTSGVFDALNSTLTFQNGNAPIARTAGTLSLGSTANLIFGTPGNLGGNGFTIPANTFTNANTTVNSLTINRTNALAMNAQTITIDGGALNLTAGVFNINTGSLVFQNAATPIVRTTGTITVATTSNLTFGSHPSNFTIPANTFTAAPSLNNLTIDRVGGVTIGNQAFTINGTLTLTNGVFDILNTPLTMQTGATPIARTSGTLTVGTGASLSFGTNAANFVIPDNVFTTEPTITNLTINRAGGITLGNQSVTLIGTLTLTAGVFDVLNTTLTFQTSNTPIARNGTTQTGTITVGTNANLIFGTAGNTGGNAFTLPNNVFTTTPAINNFTVNRTNALTLGNQDLTINGSLTLTLGAFSIANNTLTFQNGDVPIARTSGTLTVGGNASIVFGTTGNTNGAAFTLPNGLFTATPPVFANFTINRTNSLTLNNTQGFTLSGNLNLTAGTLDNTGRAITMSAGNITGTGTEVGAGVITMSGASATISGATISNVALNNVTGFSLTGSPTVTGTLTLTNGALTVGANALTFHTGNTPIARTAGTITLESTSSLVFGTAGNTGGAAFTIPANTFTTAPEFVNFTMNRTNSLTLNNQNFAITGLFTLTAGQLILPSNFIFTLRSTSIANTAMVDKVGATGSIAYNSGAAFRVERFIPKTGEGIRAYRDVAPSVNTGSRTIFSTWQEGGTNGLVNGVYYGTHISGKAGASPGGVDATTGLDLTSTGSASLYSSNISLTTGADAFAAITSTNQANDTLSALKGYRILIRGNRLVDLYQFPTPTTMNAATILRSTGTLILGDVTFTTTGTTANGGTNTSIRLNSASTTGYTMIGNPYASAVVWDSLAANSTSIDQTYWVFDPNIGTSGSYVTYNTLTGSSNAASGINKYIQPGQSFFIRNTALAPAPVLLFKEAFKAANTANLTGIYRTATTSIGSVSKISILVKKPVTNRGIITADATAVAFNSSFANTIGPEDGSKISNGGENLAMFSNGNTLSIEGRKRPHANDTLTLKLWQVTAGVSYQLDINTTEYSSLDLQPYLYDRFMNKVVSVGSNTTFTYPFVTTSDTNSYNNRFRLVFRAMGATLPINFTSVKANQYNTGVNVTWSAVESDVQHYQVQHATDGVNFTTIGIINAKGNNMSSIQQYMLYHATPVNGNNYYRVVAIELNGNTKTSDVVMVNLSGKTPSISIYPNPIKGRVMNLQMQHMATGTYVLMLHNTQGQQVFTSSLQLSAANMAQAIQLPNTIASGQYLLTIMQADGQSKQVMQVKVD